MYVSFYDEYYLLLLSFYRSVVCFKLIINKKMKEKLNINLKIYELLLNILYNVYSNGTKILYMTSL
jgi:hypothetical protein